MIAQKAAAAARKFNLVSAGPHDMLAGADFVSAAAPGQARQQLADLDKPC
jgi:hypothetical protein